MTINYFNVHRVATVLLNAIVIQRNMQITSNIREINMYTSKQLYVEMEHSIGAPYSNYRASSKTKARKAPFSNTIKPCNHR